MKKLITQAVFDEAKPEDGDYYVGDTRLPGFRLKVTPAGKKVLSFSYRSPDGRQRRITYEHMTVDQARLAAEKARIEVKSGRDPQAGADALAVMPTLEQAFEMFAQDRVDAGKMKPGTRDEYRRIIKTSVPDKLKGKKVGEITRADIEQLKRDMRSRQAMANATLRVLKAIFSWCEGAGQCIPQGANPAHKVELYPARKRSFLFEDDELMRLAKVLDEAEATSWPPAIACFRLLLLTGMRRDEVRELTWAEVDLERRRIRLKDSKVGARDVPLGRGAIEVLEALQRINAVFPSQYVIPSPQDRNRPFSGLSKLWQRLRKKAGLEHVRIHDLRHNFGGMGATETRSAVHVKALLGHTQITTTDRYMKLADHSVLSAADDVTDAITKQMGRAR